MSDALRHAFERGDYHRVAATGAADSWRTHAALGLCGNIAPALEGLARIDDPEARFHEGVIHWIDGDEDAAIRLLAACDNEHADNLLRLIRKPRISILAQLPWQRSPVGPHTLLEAGQNDPKFALRNISFKAGDLKNAPDADIHNFYDARNPPDLYLAEMVEWHVIPPNLQELPCPLIGQTGDYDLHIQTVYPWLRLFDEIVVTDSTEYADAAGLSDAPVTTFCKPVSLPLAMLPEIDGKRDLDLVLTGSVLHSYFPDKAEMMRQLLETDGLQPFFLSGFLYYYLYYPILARSKLSVALTRHPGAIPSRGYEALAMGTVLLAPHQSCLRLFAGDDAGVVPFALADDGLRRAVETVLADYPRHAEGAQRGMRIVRREFDPYRVASQYLRMATFLAARPRAPRAMAATRPMQKRPVAYKGWLQEDAQATHQALRNASLARWKAIAPQDHTLETVCDPARELLLEYVHATLMPDDRDHAPLVETALNIFRSAMELFPDSLALRFNFVRAALHFGAEADIDEALRIAGDTLEADPATLGLDPLDDVMTWDYCQNFFNYRDYLQTVTEALRDHTDRTAELKALIRASLHFYYGRMADEPGHFARAAALDPAFSAYRLWQAKALAESGNAADVARAAPILAGVVREILYGPEAWALLQYLKAAQGIAIPEENRLRRLIERMESRTLIDEAYAAIRIGPYFRTQRLSLARNPGVEIRKAPADDAPPVRLSVLLADVNGSRYGRLIDALTRQTLGRDAFEIVCCDVFDHVAPAMREHADTILVCGQNEHLYNRNAAFNQALLRARGDLVAFVDGDAALGQSALADLLDAAGAADSRRIAFVDDDRAPRVAALFHDAAIDAGGLDESAYYAAALSGPGELLDRLRARRWAIRVFDGLATDKPTERPDASGLRHLFGEIWPAKFDAFRMMPLRENPEIARRRADPR